MKKICINCGNLHDGGGVQVATSFIYELLNSVNFNDLDISLNISNEVFSNLQDLGCDLNQFSSVSRLDIYGFSALKAKTRKYFNDFNVIFTLFGPDYLIFNRRAIKITGFAQPWVIYPNNEVYDNLNLISKIKNKVKFYLYKKFFSHSNQIIVEIDHVKKKLSNMKEFKNKPINVVHNCLASIYRDTNKWKPIKIPKANSDFSIGFLGRDYLHKNTNILPIVKEELLAKYKKNVTFYVTFNEEEWEQKSNKFKSAVCNIGALSVSQCPSFYESMNAIIFPSLLECFSATPLEAMAMKKPLFASDRDFIRDVCKEYAFYFDPLDPLSAAHMINQYIDNMNNNDSLRLENAKLHALDFSTSKQRAEQYIEILRNC